MTVFAGKRVTANNVFGTVSDNPLTNVAVALNSAGLTNLPAVSGDHAILVLDPLRTAGAPELIVVTAHTASATVATVTRGAYGTTARQHLNGVMWVHAPTIDDVIRICTSSTRPADQYEGQLIYETDTDYVMGHNGTAWEHGLKLGAWQTWSPTLTNITVGNGTQTARYVKIGRTVQWAWRLVLGSTSAIGTLPTITVPLVAVGTITGAAAIATDVGAGPYELLLREIAATSSLGFYRTSGVTATLDQAVSATVPFAWGATDVLEAAGAYEAAS